MNLHMRARALIEEQRLIGLIHAKADPNEKDQVGRTLITRAAHELQLGLLRTLINAKADLDAAS